MGISKNIFPIWRCIIDNGQMTILEKEKFDNYIRGFRNGEAELIVRKAFRKRSDEQNKYYWSCVVAIPAEHFGYYADEMHEAYKLLFLKKEEQGKPTTIRSTTSLSTIEFKEFVERCRMWAEEQGLEIPDPSGVDLSY